MPRIEYVKCKLRAAALAVIEQANQIIAEYEAQGLSLTLRQMYYQFVSRALIPNNDREYKKLGSIISDARRCGLIDWEAIEDRTRFLRGRVVHAEPSHALSDLAKRYAIPLWDGQEFRVEVWIEKDALLGVIEGACGALDVNYFSCRGYTSDSEAWHASQRFLSYYNAGQRGIIFHLGDHDPSGVDMTREIQQRMDMFLGARAPHVRRIALTMNQVEEYNPPPNPAKITDPRAVRYIDEYGDQSWELDALEPTVMRDLIAGQVQAVMDEEKWSARRDLEKKQRKQIELVGQHWAKALAAARKKK